MTAAETEAVGKALMEIERTIRDIGTQFDLAPEDLNLDLGTIKLSVSPRLIGGGRRERRCPLLCSACYRIAHFWANLMRFGRIRVRYRSCSLTRQPRHRGANRTTAPSSFSSSIPGGHSNVRPRPVPRRSRRVSRAFRRTLRHWEALRDAARQAVRARDSVSPPRWRATLESRPAFRRAAS